MLESVRLATYKPLEVSKNVLFHAILVNMWHKTTVVKLESMLASIISPKMACLL